MPVLFNYFLFTNECIIDRRVNRKIIRPTESNRMNEIRLTANQSKALDKIKSGVEKFQVIDFLLYGSAARGET